MNEKESLNDAVDSVIQGQACFVLLTAPQVSLLISLLDDWMTGCDEDGVWGEMAEAGGMTRESCVEFLKHLQFEQP